MTAQEFTAEQVTSLLSELDRRLRLRGVRAAVFVVGGAAIAATRLRDDRLTADIDAVFDDPAVAEAAAAMAAEGGLPPDWINSAARMWMPPLPPGVLSRPDAPGLRITYAEDGFLLAAKLVAQRAKDADDVLALATRLGLQCATAEDLEAHVRRYYTDAEALRYIVGAEDVDDELRLLSEGGAAFLARRAATWLT